MANKGTSSKKKTLKLSKKEKIYICIECSRPIKTIKNKNRNLFFESENLEFDIIEHKKHHALWRKGEL
jgi:hypothetical protein